MKKIVLDKGCALLVTDRLTRKYLCGVDIAEGYVVVADEITAFTDARYFYAAEKSLAAVGIKCELYAGLESIKAHLDSLQLKKLLIDYRTATVREYENYKKFGFEIIDGSFALESARAVKQGYEIEHIEKACAIIEKAYHKAIKQVRLGMSELELKGLIEKYAFEFGAEEMSFDTIVAFGANSAVPHHETGETKLVNDTVILVDTGCKVKGYCSDLTRTAFFGKPSQKFIDCYEKVLKANLIAEENITAGISCKVADGYARDYLKESDLDKFFTHSLGHGLGLEIHEYPTLSFRSDAVLTDNMAFTVEPGVYFDGEFGIRIEDTVLLKDGKVKRLFNDDKNLIIL
jgi:Xaa-Pro aminopeptidase